MGFTLSTCAHAIFQNFSIQCRSDKRSKHGCSYTEFRDAYEALAAAWSVDMPALKERDPHALGDGEGISVMPRGEDGGGAASLWDDDQAATFYESLPDLHAVVPAVALTRGTAAAAGGDGAALEEATDAAAEATGGAADAPAVTSSAEVERTAPVPAPATAMPEAGAVAGGADEAAEGGAEAALDTGDPNYEALRRIYEQLATCYSIEQADDIAVNFCFIQSKGAPAGVVAALSRSLASSARNRLHRMRCRSLRDAQQRACDMRNEYKGSQRVQASASRWRARCRRCTSCRCSCCPFTRALQQRCRNSIPRLAPPWPMRCCAASRGRPRRRTRRRARWSRASGPRATSASCASSASLTPVRLHPLSSYLNLVQRLVCACR